MAPDASKIADQKSPPDLDLRSVGDRSHRASLIGDFVVSIANQTDLRNAGIIPTGDVRSDLIPPIPSMVDALWISAHFHKLKRTSKRHRQIGNLKFWFVDLLDSILIGHRQGEALDWLWGRERLFLRN